MHSDPVPAITEATASGETATIFADLRATLGVSVVNLIWRHIATLPGALPWAWATVKPVYLSGRVGMEAGRIKAGLAIPELPVWPRALLACAGVDDAAEESIRQILASYDHSNAVNLAALSALVRHIDGAPAASVAAAADLSQEPSIKGVLPKLLGLDEVAANTAALIRRINLFGDRSEGRITASMYRHLAHWPAFLSLCHVHLAPIAADGRLEKMVSETISLGDAAGARLQMGMAELSQPESVATVRLAVVDFIQNAISKMVPVTALLISVMPADSRRFRIRKNSLSRIPP